MKNFKIISDLKTFELMNELNLLINKQIVHWSKDNQICLNTIVGHEDNFLIGCGSLQYDWDNKITLFENGIEKIVVEKFKNPRKEEDFTILCDVFRDTIFEEVYNSLKERYKTGRIRLMKSKPKTCLSWHTDTSIRLHYPIKTQEGCFMVINDEIQHLSQNTWWWTNTLVPHTAFNSSKEERIHLVVNIL
jgi:hypothetical protein